VLLRVGQELGTLVCAPFDEDATDSDGERAGSHSPVLGSEIFETAWLMIW
jgi:hypothetical protein